MQEGGYLDGRTPRPTSRFDYLSNEVVSRIMHSECLLGRQATNPLFIRPILFATGYFCDTSEQ
jgi:hypothetical protein